jgi:hypothetical protein
LTEFIKNHYLCRVKIGYKINDFIMNNRHKSQFIMFRAVLKIFPVWGIILLSGCTNSTLQAPDFQVDFTPSENLEADFLIPPDYAKPRVFWWWLEGNISKEGILSDLSEMKKAGIKGALLFDAACGAGNAYGTMTERTKQGHAFMSPEWRELVTYACRVADSLDLEISMNITSGWNDGGPWVTPEYTS